MLYQSYRIRAPQYFMNISQNTKCDINSFPNTLMYFKREWFEGKPQANNYTMTKSTSSQSYIL